LISYSGLLDGLTATGVIISSCVIGLLFFYRSLKLKAKLLTYAGLMTFFAGLLYLGPLSDFMSILVIRDNLENPVTIGIYGRLSYMWVAPSLIFAMYIGAELIKPDKKWYIVSIYIVLGVIFELFLFLDTMNSFTFILKNPGEDLTDSTFIFGHPTFMLIAIFLLSVLIFNGFGFLYKCFKSTGILRRKFLFLSLGFIIFVIAGTGDSLISPGVLLVFIRIAMVSSSWVLYISFKI
jgi:hypothetical protein